jgi:hypothetical protein
MLKKLGERMGCADMALDMHGRMRRQFDGGFHIEFYADDEFEYFFLETTLGITRPAEHATLLNELLESNAGTVERNAPYFAYDCRNDAVLVCMAMPYWEMTVDKIEICVKHIVECAREQRFRIGSTALCTD